MSLVGAAWGGVLLLRPARVVRAVAPGEPGVPPAVVRVLGARLLAQHALLLARPLPGAVRAGVVLDVLHLASMLPAALVWPRHRRAALASAVSTAVLASAGAAVAG
ncbi:hypothetical protein GB931_01920 [Modestobacter sp. I12A-02628]|uniref:Uncharacterized protein n=1 Tax=Goekera deserti TaxID=2497753 RepID=A0A7K3WIA7_9ACTN|nr:hypothetical protein [Goekera deserti]MPQ96695.1 hypothetical protein [Goekera deserti]NDI46991.1 hypothetical protein [Goekera deserti]NEL56228.1 hypothetical protein [Goekera deserti]